MIHTAIENITPKVAAEYLRTNNMNRPLQVGAVETYAKAMQRNEWMLNGEAIQFDTEGNLVNGQHRLNAVVLSGRSVPFLVVRGVEKECFKTFDGGKKRTASDVLSIKGEQNTANLASGARAYIIYVDGPSRNSRAISASLIEKVVSEHPDLRHWTRRYASGSKSALRRMTSSLIGFLTIASERHGIEKIDLFVDKLESGANLAEDDPAFVLRERLLNQTGSKRLSKQTADAYIVKAINAYLTKKPIKILRYTEDEGFPSIV